MSQLTEEIADGRRRRSMRSRKAIIDACIELNREGLLVPTAQKVSDRAGVPIRSFFRHFPDMESLFKAIDEQLRDEYQALFFTDTQSGPLEQRIDEVVAIHANAHSVSGIPPISADTPV